MKNFPELYLMKFRVLILFYFISQLSLSQELYTSPITQLFPSAELEKINRTILITKDTIFIKSDTQYGIKTKKFVINEHTLHVFPNYGLSEFYVCSSLDNIYITYFQIPKTEKVDFIEVVEPMQYNRPSNRYRLLID